MKKMFLVTGLSDSAGAERVDACVRRLDGVDDVSVNVATGAMRVSFDEKTVRANDVIAAVTEAGYMARLAERDREEKNADDQRGAGFLRMACVWLLSLTVLYLTLVPRLGLPAWDFLTYPLSAGLTQMVLLLPVMVLSRDIFSGGMRSLKNRAPNLFTLVSLGAAAAAAYSVYELILGAWKISAGNAHVMRLYFDTSAMILALVALGKYVETRARLSTSAALARLSKLRPETARVMREGRERVVPASEVLAGETVVVRRGDAVPADGVVLSGEGEINGSVFTGRAEPATVSAGDEVLGASVCLSGEFAMRAEKPLKEMRLTQVLSLVEQASATKAPIARTADRVAGLFVPLVMILSAVTLAVWLILGYDAAFAVQSAVCVLVISCPCALGLATPTAIMAGTGKGAELGILVKNAASMEKLGGIDTVIFDKTGTLTAGEMRVSGCVLGEGTSFRALVALAASAEQLSAHPFAQALLREAHALNLPLDPAEDFEEVPGQGVRASVGGMRVLIGNLTMMERSAQDVSGWRERAGEVADGGASALFVAADGRVRGLIALRDELRDSAVEAVGMLDRMHIQTLMLTGDEQRTANAIARSAGIGETKCGLKPEDKEMMLRILQADGKKTMVVSDGARDASLSRAQLSLTVCGGSDFSAESSDVVVMHGDIRLVACALQLGRLAVRVIRENLFWAFFYNVIGIPLAAGALYRLMGLHFSPMLAAAVMCFASIFVVFNALRLRRYRPAMKSAAPKKHRLRSGMLRRAVETEGEVWEFGDE